MSFSAEMPWRWLTVAYRLADGSIKSKLHVTEGIDKAAEGLVGIFTGDNFGKAVLKIKSE